MNGPGPLSARAVAQLPEGAERSTRQPREPASCVKAPSLGACWSPGACAFEAAEAPAGNASAARAASEANARGARWKQRWLAEVTRTEPSRRCGQGQMPETAEARLSACPA